MRCVGNEHPRSTKRMFLCEMNTPALTLTRKHTRDDACLRNAISSKWNVFDDAGSVHVQMHEWFGQ